MTDTKTRLVTARLLRNLTQRRVAQRARVSVSYLAELEKSGDAPSIDLQKRIARVLQFDASELWPASTERVA